jgi:hypothetical protein
MTTKAFVLVTAFLVAGAVSTSSEKAHATDEQAGAGKVADSLSGNPVRISPSTCAELQGFAITPSEIGLPS